MGNRFLYLVRHGQYNRMNDDAGELTERGLEQAQLTAEMMASLPIDIIHCSSTVRAQQTAEVISECYSDVALKPSDTLRECIPAITPQLNEFYLSSKAPMPTEEAVAACVERLDSAYDHYFQPTVGRDDSYELIIAHGNVIRYFITRALDVRAEVWVKLAIYNCGVSLVIVDPEGNTALITHNVAIRRIADRVVHFHDGQVKEIEEIEEKIQPSELSW